MLILGSYGFTDPSVRQQIAKTITDKSGKMLILPLAASDGALMAAKEKHYAAKVGFAEENIYVFDENEPERLLCESFDHIVVPGGNTFKLLFLVRKYGLDAFIKAQVANGAHYLGFSAGAYLACGNIEYVKCFDDDNHIQGGDYTALELTDKYVLCHYDNRGPAEIAMCRNYLGFGPELITIKDSEIKCF